MVNEDAVGPDVNPFKALYWQQFGEQPDAKLLEQMKWANAEKMDGGRRNRKAK
jgi:hypothetical protein